MIYSLLVILGFSQYAAAWADLIYSGSVLIAFALLYVNQVKLVKRGLMVDRLKGVETVNPFKDHPLAYRVILLLLCLFVAWFWPFYLVMKFAGYLTKTS